LKTTENYLASFEKEERVKNAAFLTNFGMNNLKTTCILENILQNRDDNGKYFAKSVDMSLLMEIFCMELDF
jgi:hypothetical protein